MAIDINCTTVNVIFFVSRIQGIGCQPQKKATVANPARGLLNREKRTNEKVIVWQRTPPSPTLLVRIPSTRRLGQWVSLRKILRFRVQ